MNKAKRIFLQFLYINGLSFIIIFLHKEIPAFLSYFLLWGLLPLSVPIIIYYWSKQQEEKFSTIIFFQSITLWIAFLFLTQTTVVDFFRSGFMNLNNLNQTTQLNRYKYYKISGFNPQELYHSSFQITYNRNFGNPDVSKEVGFVKNYHIFRAFNNTLNNYFVVEIIEKTEFSDNDFSSDLIDINEATIVCKEVVEKNVSKDLSSFENNIYKKNVYLEYIPDFNRYKNKSIILTVLYFLLINLIWGGGASYKIIKMNK